MTLSILTQENSGRKQPCDPTTDIDVPADESGFVNLDNLDTGSYDVMAAMDEGSCPNPEAPTLTEKHREDLRKSGLTDEQIAAAGFRSIDAEQAEDYGFPCSGMLIPYPDCGDYCRLKTDSGEPKYLSRKGSRNHLYIPPATRAVLQDAGTPLLITEGEKKALKADQEGFRTIGLSGVWNWKTKAEGLLPEFGEIRWKGRKVYVVFDSDIRGNSEVQAALRALVKELEAKGADVKVVLLPEGTNHQKVGLDDYLVSQPARDLTTLMGAAVSMPHAVLECIEPGLNPAQLQARLQDIYRAAQQYEGSGREIAKAIRERMRTHGFEPSPLAEIEKAIRRVKPFQSSRTGQNDDEAESVDMEPNVAAAAFLEENYTLKGQNTLQFYRDAFHEWKGTHYRAATPSDFEATVMRWLQLRKLTCKESFCRDVIANLKALVHLKTSEHAPFRVENAVGLEDAEVTPCRAIVCRNCVIPLDELAGGSLCQDEHSPAYFNTSCLPYDYDGGADCPEWAQFLDEVLEGDQDRISLLQEMFGYCLLGDLRHHKFFILSGNGSNGKSVVLEILEAMLGTENVSHLSLDQFSDRFSLGCMEGRMANIYADLKELDNVEEGLLKTLTAGEPVQVDQKFREPHAMKPTAVLVFSANKLPTFRDRSSGIWRRLVVMPFEVEIPENKQDTQLAHKLRLELPGILNWSIQGLMRLMAQSSFTSAAKCREAASQHRHDSDHMLPFLDERTEVKPGVSIRCSALYGDYKNWAEQNGFKPLSNANFGRALKQHRPAVSRVEKQLKLPLGGRQKVYEYDGITGTP